MQEYKNALTFWNNYFDAIEPQKTDAELGCKALDDAFIYITKNAKTLLDFGCGAGWASHYIALANYCSNITAVDQAEKSVNFSKKTAQLSGIEDKINYIVTDENYLFNVASGSFDAIFSSNVLDVIPTEVAQTILQGFARVLAKNGKAVIMLNPYLTQEYADKVGMVQIGKKAYAKDGNLRCINYTQEEWTEIFATYFIVDRYEEFTFDGEKLENKRRLFYLSKK